MHRNSKCRAWRAYLKSSYVHSFFSCFAPWKPSPDPLRSLMKQSKLLLKRSKRLNSWSPKETKVLKRLQVNYLSLLLQVSENIFIIFKSSSSLGQNLTCIPRELDDHMQTFQARPTTVHSFSKTQMISQETELMDLQNTRYYSKERSKQWSYFCLLQCFLLKATPSRLLALKTHSPT